MITRSQSKLQDNNNYPTPTSIPFTFDFDEASNAWKANKIYIGNGCYKYKCMGYTKKNNACKNASFRGHNFCKLHLKNT